MIGNFLRKVKEMRRGEFSNQGSKQLETSEKPNSPTNWSINSTNRDVSGGHDLWSAATTHLMRCEILRVAYSKKKKKNLSSSMVVMTCHDDHRIRGQLMGITKSTGDEPNKTY